MDLTKKVVSVGDIGHFKKVLGMDTPEETYQMVNEWEYNTPLNMYKNLDFELYRNQALGLIVSVISNDIKYAMLGFVEYSGNASGVLYYILGEKGQNYGVRLRDTKEEPDVDVTRVPITHFIRLIQHYITDTVGVLIKENRKTVSEDYYIGKISKMRELGHFINMSYLKVYYKSFETTRLEVVHNVLTHVEDVLKGEEYTDTSKEKVKNIYDLVKYNLEYDLDKVGKLEVQLMKENGGTNT